MGQNQVDLRHPIIHERVHESSREWPSNYVSIHGSFVQTVRTDGLVTPKSYLIDIGPLEGRGRGVHHEFGFDAGVQDDADDPSSVFQHGAAE